MTINAWSKSPCRRSRSSNRPTNLSTWARLQHVALVGVEHRLPIVPPRRVNRADLGRFEAGDENLVSGVIPAAVLVADPRVMGKQEVTEDEEGFLGDCRRLRFDLQAMQERFETPGRIGRLFEVGAQRGLRQPSRPLGWQCCVRQNQCRVAGEGTNT